MIDFSARRLTYVLFDVCWTLWLEELRSGKHHIIGCQPEWAAYFEKELTAFVTYDHRLLNGCRDIGLTTASPRGAR
jgi:hypothetical protein